MQNLVAVSDIVCAHVGRPKKNWGRWDSLHWDGARLTPRNTPLPTRVPRQIWLLWDKQCERNYRDPLEKYDHSRFTF